MVGVMITISKVFTNSFVLFLLGQEIPWHLSKQISKLFFKICAHLEIILLLAKLIGQEGHFLEGACEGVGGFNVRFAPRAFAVVKDEKGLTLCEIRNNLTPFFLFTRPTYKLVQEGMEFYDKCYRQIPGLVKRVLLSPRERPNNYSVFNEKCVGVCCDTDHASLESYS